jgi:hypothetical protein
VERPGRRLPPCQCAATSAAEITRNLGAAGDAYQSRVIARQRINLKPSSGIPPEAEATNGAGPKRELLRHLHEHSVRSSIWRSGSVAAAAWRSHKGRR